jgi:hypothetical protein
MLIQVLLREKTRETQTKSLMFASQKNQVTTHLPPLVQSTLNSGNQIPLREKKVSLEEKENKPVLLAAPGIMQEHATVVLLIQ